MSRKTLLLPLVLIAGCGSNSTTTSSTSGNTSFQSEAAQAYKFSACMRGHGVANFPDPQVSSANGQNSIMLRKPPGMGTPAFKSATRACAKYAPPRTGKGPGAQKSPAQVQAIFALAKCLRNNGFPSFPDPNSQGGLSDQKLNASHIDITQPGFLSAATKCLPVTHGQITPAMLHQAINHNASGQ
ncbi:MAG: hypothetical protein J2O48_05915 [Solirubrobacterales bacterium]|nr:hypothetical protein [Solirubrobacterales bacterium]